LGRGLPAELKDACRERGSGEASEAADNAMMASATQRMRGFLRSMPPTVTLPTRDAVGKRSSA
jgi:hypothetical protein